MLFTKSDGESACAVAAAGTTSAVAAAGTTANAKQTIAICMSLILNHVDPSPRCVNPAPRARPWNQHATRSPAPGSTAGPPSREFHCESRCEKLVKIFVALRATAQSAKGVARGGGRTALHLEKTNGRRRPGAEPPPPLPPAPAPANDVLTPSDGRKRCSIQGRVLSDT